MDWLTLITGIVIGVIATLLSGPLMLLLEYKTPWFARSHPDSFDESWNNYFEKPTPWDIGGVLKKKLLTVQRNLVLQSHVGKRVRWYVSFDIMKIVSTDITELFFQPVLTKILFIPILDKSTYIFCQVNREQYPQFNDLSEGKKMWIKGEILSLEDMGSLVTIKIDNADFKFDK